MVIKEKLCSNFALRVSLVAVKCEKLNGPFFFFFYKIKLSNFLTHEKRQSNK